MWVTSGFDKNLLWVAAETFWGGVFCAATLPVLIAVAKSAAATSM